MCSIKLNKVLTNKNLSIMANWVEVTYKVVGDKNTVVSLKNCLDDLYSDNDDKWLYKLVDKLGGDSDKISCRAELNDYTLENDVLTIIMFAANVEQTELRFFLEEQFKGIKIYYRQELTGEFYSTNDLEHIFFKPYIVETDEDKYYFDTLDEASKKVSEIIGHDVPCVFDKLKEMCAEYNEENDYDVFCYIEKFKLNDESKFEFVYFEDIDLKMWVQTKE